jgi:hypothetical protein
MQERIGAQGLDRVDLEVDHGARAARDHEVLGTHAHRDRLGRARAQLRGNRYAHARAQVDLVAHALAREEIHRRRADEARHEKRRRIVVDVDRAADLLDRALVHHDHAVGERHRLDLVVGHEDAGGLQLPVQLLDLQAHLHAQLRVEVGQRLVEQERGRLAHDRASHGDALALAARKRTRLPVEERTELEDLRRALHAHVDLLGRHAPDAQPVGHVFVHRHVRIERVVLEHHGDIAVLGLDAVHHLAGDRDLALGDRLQPGDHPEQRRLAAARGTDDHDELAVGDLHVHAVDHLQLLGVALLDVPERDLGHVSYFSVSTRPFTNHFCIVTTTSAAAAGRASRWP